MAIDAQKPNGDTPTVPALQGEGALEHPTAWADQGGKLQVQFGCATIVAPPR